MSKIVGHISQVIGPVVDVYFKFEEGQDVEHALPKSTMPIDDCP